VTLDRQYINAPGAPAPIAVRMGSLLFVSGQLSLEDGQGKLVAPGDLAGQTRQALENLTSVLTASGASWTNVAKLTVFVVGIEDIAKVREARAAFYAEKGIEAPASTAVGVPGLAIEGALVEIEAYAVLE
jgi:enamine deaminase RidA (YjgF/YER057c/UK114 family)